MGKATHEWLTWRHQHRMACRFADTHLPCRDSWRGTSQNSGGFSRLSPGSLVEADCVHSRYNAMTTLWEHKGLRGRGIRVEYITDFDARGMCRVYGRGDHFGRGRTFHMDVWLTRGGRLLARFWARRDEVDALSLEVFNQSHASPPKRKTCAMNESWVPQCLREEYDNWITSEL